MPLHRKRTAAHTEFDDIYASSDFSVRVPKYKFPAHQRDPRHAYEMVHDELILDGGSRQNLATFCTTWLEPEVRQLMSDCFDKNMIDKDEYPVTAEIENRCVHMLADLWNAPHAARTIGCSTTGSSEAAMLGALALKWKWRERRRAAGKATDRPNLVTGPVQICWHKFCRYFDVELREIPMEGDRLILSGEEIAAYCDENTIGVVPTLGVTYTCQYEPVKAIAAALDRLQAERGLDIPIHVDGASGAFLAPFIDPHLEWDFRIPRVKSINASGHKFGLAPLGVGWIIWRELADLPEDLIFDVNYLGGHMPTFALNFSRPGGEIVCQYYNFLRLGKDGYRKVHEACYTTAQFLAREIGKLAPFDVLFDGRGGLPGVCWTLKPDARAGFTLYDLADRLRTTGWLVPAYSMPANRTDLVVQRLLVRHGFSRDLGASLINDIHAALRHFKQHPIEAPLTEREAGGHNHTGHVRHAQAPVA
ncbi:MAG: glutamate decarboxylase [Vulcanimicrobiaceae bacterium]